MNYTTLTVPYNISGYNIAYNYNYSLLVINRSYRSDANSRTTIELLLSVVSEVPSVQHVKR